MLYSFWEVNKLEHLGAKRDGYLRRNDTHNKDTQYNDTQHEGKWHWYYDTSHNNIIMTVSVNDIKFNNTKKDIAA